MAVYGKAGLAVLRVEMDEGGVVEIEGAFQVAKETRGNEADYPFPEKRIARVSHGFTLIEIRTVGGYASAMPASRP